MNKYILIVVGLLLAGAGCIQPQQPPTDSQSSTTSPADTASADNQAGNRSTQTTPNRASGSANATVDAGEESTSPEIIESDLSGLPPGSVIVDDEDCRGFINNTVSTPGILEACKTHVTLADRFAKSGIEATPDGSKFYDYQEGWMTLDPEGSACSEAGQAAGLKLLTAQQAFVDGKSTTNLEAQAKAAEAAWLKAIIAFEKKWHVGAGR